ncbi:MAG: hypothetical protein ACOC5M_01535 [Chloroflexota bacterium]
MALLPGFLTVGYLRRKANKLAESAFQTEDLEDSRRLFDEAVSRYERILEVRSGDYDALMKLGHIYFKRALHKDGQSAADDSKTAESYYRAGLRLSPESSAVMTLRARALIVQAASLDGAQSERLLDQAEEQLRRALGVDPENASAMHAYGATLATRARLREGAEERLALEQALSRLEAAEEVSPGIARYGMACVHARLGDSERCRELLTGMMADNDEGNLPPPERIWHDPDFADVRQEPWFQDFLEELAAKHDRPREWLYTR